MTVKLFHGVPITIRVVGAHTHTEMPRDYGQPSLTRIAKCITNHSGPIILSWRGRYLARVHKSQVKRFANHFALRIMLGHLKE